MASSMRASTARICRSASAATALTSVARDARVPSSPFKRPKRRTPFACKRGEVERRVIGSSDELERRFGPGGNQFVGSVEIVDRPVEGPDHVEPPEDVHASVLTRQATVAADGERDVPAGSGATRLRAALRWRPRRPRGLRRREGCRAAVVSGVTWWMCEDSRPAIAGIAGRSHQPVAMTTLSEQNAPSSVSTTKPSPRAATRRMVVCSRTGASNDAA